MSTKQNCTAERWRNASAREAEAFTDKEWGALCALLFALSMLVLWLPV